MHALVALAVLGSANFGADTPRPAADLLKEATTAAVKNDTKVLVIFHATWCGWCKRMDAFLEQPTYKSLFAKNYEIVHLDVMEQPEKKNVENPGAQEYMVKWKGETAGLPFTVILDNEGKKIIDSLRDGEPKGNIGWAWEPQEVAWFLTMFDKTATHVTPEERKTLESDLLKQKAVQEAKQKAGGGGGGS